MSRQPGSAPAGENVTGRRIAAAIVDVLLLSLLLGVMAALFGDADSEDDSFSVNLSGLPGLAFLLMVLAYYFVLETLYGQTLGKRLMGVRVAAVDGALTPLKVAVRTILRIVDGLPFLYLLGLVLVAVTRRNQRLGDIAAGTLVVRA